MVALAPLPKTGRVNRRPSYSFNFGARPWQMVPFLLAPVLPGETLKNCFFQSRVVTDPVKSRLTGWWIEYYFFYVRLRDLTGATDFEEMMLDPNKDMSAYASAANAAYFHRGGINYRLLAMNKIADHYFRAPDEAQQVVGDYHISSIDVETVMDSAILSADFVTPNDVDVDANSDDTITASEVDKAMRMWEFAKMNQLTDMDFDDYLRTFGIAVPKAQSDKPELLRVVREWQYPSNTINPADGAASTAVSWAVKDKIAKDYFFREPGFIVGISNARPKVYLGNVQGSFTSRMEDALSWLPAIMRDDPYSSLKEFDNAVSSPVAGLSGDYWVDLRDLFIYGEQFYVGSDRPTVALPSSSMQKRYASLADMRALFTDSGEAGALQFVRQDGIANLEILGSQRDTTPPISRLSV